MRLQEEGVLVSGHRHLLTFLLFLATLHHNYRRMGRIEIGHSMLLHKLHLDGVAAYFQVSFFISVHAFARLLLLYGRLFVFFRLKLDTLRNAIRYKIGFRLAERGGLF